MKASTMVRRCPHDGMWEAGVSCDGRPWRWAKLHTKRSDVAKKRAPEALAILFEGFAQEFEVIASTFVEMASLARARASAEVKEG